MIRGKQEDTCGAVEDIQVVQKEGEEEEEEEEEMKTEKEEEMKTENMEGTESTENVSSGAFGEISGAPTQKRTTVILNSAQAVSTGVANDSKQALTPQLAARGLFEMICRRATNIYNSIYKATSIPNRLDINSSDTTTNNNNNINGIDNVIQNEENSISVNSIDNTINIYDACGVDNIIEIGENQGEVPLKPVFSEHAAEVRDTSR
jgi:hypothetical protein